MISRLIEAADARRTVLTPSAELAAALFDAVERAYRESGREVWPTPRVRDFGGWLRERHLQGQLRDSSTPRCLSEVEERELWRRAVLDSEAGAQFLEPSGAARAARRARRAMAEYGIPKRALAAYGTEESLALLDWSARFADQCRALHCIGGERLLEQAVELTLDAEPQPPLWIESPLWRPVAKTWLLRNLGPPLEPVPAAPAPAARAPARYIKADSPAAELAAIAAWAFEKLKTNPEFRAWVCVPRFGRAAPRGGGGTPTQRSPPQRFSLARVAGRRPVRNRRRHASRRVRTGTRGARFSVRRGREPCHSADSARCCARRNFRPRRREAAAASRLDAALRALRTERGAARRLAGAFGAHRA